MSIRSSLAGTPRYVTPKAHVLNYHKLFYMKKSLPMHVLNTGSRVAFRVMRGDDIAMGVANALMMNSNVNYADEQHSGSWDRVAHGESKSEAFKSDKLARSPNRRKDKHQYGDLNAEQIAEEAPKTPEKQFKFDRNNSHAKHASVKKFIDLLARQKKGEHALRVADLFETAGYIPNISNFNRLMMLALQKNRKNTYFAHPEVKTASVEEANASPTSSTRGQRESSSLRSPTVAVAAPAIVNPVLGPPPAAELLQVMDKETLRRVALVVDKLRPSGSQYQPSTDLANAVLKLWESCMSIAEPPKTTTASPSASSTQVTAAFPNIYRAGSDGEGWALALLLYNKMLEQRRYPDRYTNGLVLTAYRRGGLWAHGILMFIRMLEESGMDVAGTRGSPSSSNQKEVGGSDLNSTCNPNQFIYSQTFSLALACARQCPDYRVAFELFNLGVRAAAEGRLEIAEGSFVTMMRAVDDAQVLSAHEIELSIAQQRISSSATGDRSLSDAIKRSHNKWADYALQLLEGVPPSMLRIAIINTTLTILGRAGRTDEAAALCGKIGATKVTKINGLAELVNGSDIEPEIETEQVDAGVGGAMGSIETLLSASLEDAAMAEKIAEAALQTGGTKAPLAKSDGEVADEDPLGRYFFGEDEEGLNAGGKNDAAAGVGLPIGARRETSPEATSGSKPAKTTSSDEELSLTHKRHLFDKTLAHMSPDKELMDIFHGIMAKVAVQKDLEEESAAAAPHRETFEGSDQRPHPHYRSFLLVSHASQHSRGPSTVSGAAFSAPTTSDESLFTVYNWCRSLGLPLPKTVLAQLLLSLYRRDLNKTAEALVSSWIRDACTNPGDTNISLRDLNQALSLCILSHPRPDIAAKLLDKHHHRISALINPMTEGFGDMGDDAGRSTWIFESVEIRKKVWGQPTSQALAEDRDKVSHDKTSVGSATTRIAPTIAVVDGPTFCQKQFSHLLNHYDRVVVSYPDLLHFVASGAVTYQRTPNAPSSSHTLVGGELQLRERKRVDQWLRGISFDPVTNEATTRNSKSDGQASEEDPDWGSLPHEDETINASGANTPAKSTNNTVPPRVAKCMLMPFSHQLHAHSFLLSPPGAYHLAENNKHRSKSVTSDSQLLLASLLEEQATAAPNNVEAGGQDNEAFPNISVRGGIRANTMARSSTRRPASEEVRASTIDTTNPRFVATFVARPPADIPTSPPDLSMFLGCTPGSHGLAAAIMIATLNKDPTPPTGGQKSVRENGDGDQRHSLEVAIAEQGAEVPQRLKLRYDERRAIHINYERLQKRGITEASEENLKRSLAMFNAPNCTATVDYYVASKERATALKRWLRGVTSDKSLVDIRWMPPRAIAEAVKAAEAELHRLAAVYQK